VPCDTRTLPGQTLTERKTEVRKALARLESLLASRAVKPVVGPQGAIAFDGWTEADKGRVSDACAYRLLMSGGGTLAKTAIARAEAMAGRSVNKQAVAVGAHSHDGGATWHSHKG
jgi:hypothetical protein